MVNVRVIFSTKILGKSLMLGDGSTVDIQKFEELFVGASPDYTYMLLCAIDGYVDKDNIGMGYKKFFDICKAKGIIV